MKQTIKRVALGSISSLLLFSAPVFASVPNNSVTSAKIVNGAVQSVDIADNTLTYYDLGAGSVRQSELNADSVTSAKIVDGTITSADLDGGGVIPDGSITTAKIADSAVTSAKVAADTLVAGDIATGAVTTTEILDSTVVSADVAADTLVAGDLAADSVGTSEIATNGVGSDEITDSSVTSSKLNADSVTSSAITDDAVGASEIAADAVRASEIQADAVGTSEVADGSLVAADLAADSVAASEIAAGAVGTSELSSSFTANTSGNISVTGAPVGNTGAVNVVSPLSATGSVFQAAIKGRADVAAGFGSSTFTTPAVAWGVRGEVDGSNLTETYNYVAGVTGKYSITGTNASTFPKAGVLGIVDVATTTADAAVMAELDGDTGLTTARAGFGIMMINSTGGSGFDYGMDLKLQTIAGHTDFSTDFNKADIRLSSSQEVYSGSAATRAAVRAQAGTQGAIGSVYLSSAGKMYLKVAAAGADTDWNLVSTTAAD